MTDYKPGLYAVTSWRGENQLAFRTERGEDMRWCVLDGHDTRGLSDDEVTDVRPLVVLDLAGCGNAATQLRYIADQYTVNADRSLLLRLAGQIEAQTKPPRIPEPGQWGVVADAQGEVFIHIGMSVWRSVQDGIGRSWEDIHSPTLIREGVQA